MNTLSSSPLQFPFDPVRGFNSIASYNNNSNSNNMNINNINNTKQTLINSKDEEDFSVSRKLIPINFLLNNNSNNNSNDNFNFTYNKNEINNNNNNNNQSFFSNNRYSPYSKKIQTSQLLNTKVEINNNNNNNLNNNNNKSINNNNHSFSALASLASNIAINTPTKNIFIPTSLQDIKNVLLLEPVSPSSSASSSPRSDIPDNQSFPSSASSTPSSSFLYVSALPYVNNNSNNNNHGSHSNNSSPLSSPSFSSNYINIFADNNNNNNNNGTKISTVNIMNAIQSNVNKNNSINNNNNNNNNNKDINNNLINSFKGEEIKELDQAFFGDLKPNHITPIQSFKAVFNNTIEYLTYEISKIRNYSSASTFYLGSRFPITFKTVESFIIVSLFINSHSLDRISDYWSTTQAKVFPGVSLIPRILSRNKYFEIKSSLSHVLSIGLLDNIQNILYNDIAALQKLNKAFNNNSSSSNNNNSNSNSSNSNDSNNKFKTPVKHRNSTKELAAFNLILEYGLSNSIDIFSNLRQCTTSVPQFVESLTEQISSEESNNPNNNSNTQHTLLQSNKKKNCFSCKFKNSNNNNNNNNNTSLISTFKCSKCNLHYHNECFKTSHLNNNNNSNNNNNNNNNINNINNI